MLPLFLHLSTTPSEAQAAAEERTQRQINPRQRRSRSGSAAQLWRSANVAVRTQKSLRNLTEVAAAALTAQQQQRDADGAVDCLMQRTTRRSVQLAQQTRQVKIAQRGKTTVYCKQNYNNKNNAPWLQLQRQHRRQLWL